MHTSAAGNSGGGGEGRKGGSRWDNNGDTNEHQRGIFVFVQLLYYKAMSLFVRLSFGHAKKNINLILKRFRDFISVFIISFFFYVMRTDNLLYD